MLNIRDLRYLRSEDGSIKRDNLWLIRVMSSDIFKNRSVKIFLIVFTIFEMFVFVFNFISLLMAFTTDFAIKYLPMTFYTFYGIFVWNHLVTKVTFISDDPLGFCWTEDCMGPETTSKINRKALIFNVWFFSLQMSKLLLAFVLAVPTEQDDDFYYVLNFAKSHPFPGDSIFEILYRAALPPHLYTMLVASYQAIYNVYHLQVQFLLLRVRVEKSNESLERKEEGRNPVELAHDGFYQEELGDKLISCIKRYQGLIEIGLEQNSQFGIFMLPLTIAASLAGIGGLLALYNSIVNQVDYPRTVLCMVTFASSLWGLTTVGQILQEETEKFYIAVCDMPWYNMNLKNLRNFKIFLLLCHEPFTLSFSSGIILNFSIGLNVCKTVYQIGSVFCSF